LGVLIPQGSVFHLNKMLDIWRRVAVPFQTNESYILKI
jgi:hypothetical protein